MENEEKDIKTLTTAYKWTTKDYTSDDKLTLSCLMRIADSTEMISKKYSDLEIENERWKKRSKENYEEIKRLGKTIKGLKGRITRLKNLLAGKVKK